MRSSKGRVLDYSFLKTNSISFYSQIITQRDEMISNPAALLSTKYAFVNTKQASKSMAMEYPLVH